MTRPNLAPNSKQARYGVVGWPIEHSRSPELHNEWFARHKLDAFYDKFAVAPEAIEGWLKSAPQELRGLNITVPHKAAAAKVAQEQSPLVATLQAANTLARLPAGGWRAENTDAPGFAEVLAALLRTTTAQQSAVVLGAGGTAAAAVAGLALAGLTEIYLLARRAEQAEALKARLAGFVEIKTLPWAEIPNLARNTQTPLSVVIHTTPLGMSTNKDAESASALAALIEAIPWQEITKNAPPVLLDAVYPMSPLVETARTQGFIANDGMPLLRAQARLSFQHWFGFLPDKT